MIAFATLARKDLALLGRDRAGLFWLFVFPVAIALLLGVLSGGMHGMQPVSLLALDQDRSPGSRALIAALARSPALRVQAVDDAGAGEAALRGGRAVALLVLQPAQGGAQDAGSRMPALELRADPARAVEIALLGGLIAEAVDGAKAPHVVAVPVSSGPVSSGPVSSGPVGTLPLGDDAARPFDTSIPVGMAWALIGCAASFALSIARERQGGTLLRLRAAPLTRADIVAGKALACWLACLAALALPLVVGMLFFAMRPHDAVALAMAFAAAAWCFTGLTVLIGQLARDELSAVASAWAVMLVLALSGGAVLPLAAMPEWSQALVAASPVRWAVVAFEGALWKGQDWRGLLQPCLALAAVGLATGALGGVLARYRG